MKSSTQSSATSHLFVRFVAAITSLKVWTRSYLPTTRSMRLLVTFSRTRARIKRTNGRLRRAQSFCLGRSTCKKNGGRSPRRVFLPTARHTASPFSPDGAFPVRHTSNRSCQCCIRERCWSPRLTVDKESRVCGTCLVTAG